MLRLHKVTAGYAGKTVLNGVSLALPGPVSAVTGPSGCGKTTLLYVLAGLLLPWSGHVEGADGRRISMVFQEDRLLPWCTALENVAAPLPGEKEDRERIALEWLTRMELSDAANLFSGALSGGMRRRVAIARACAYGGDLLLLDEPFNGLDEALRARIAPAVKSAAPTLVMVSHNPQDAGLLGAEIVEM